MRAACASKIMILLSTHLRRTDIPEEEPYNRLYESPEFKTLPYVNIQIYFSRMGIARLRAFFGRTVPP